MSDLWTKAVGLLEMLVKAVVAVAVSSDERWVGFETEWSCDKGFYHRSDGSFRVSDIVGVREVENERGDQLSEIFLRGGHCVKVFCDLDGIHRDIESAHRDSAASFEGPTSGSS